jgi:hypothetical protein
MPPATGALPLVVSASGRPLPPFRVSGSAVLEATAIGSVPSSSTLSRVRLFCLHSKVRQEVVLVAGDANLPVHTCQCSFCAQVRRQCRASAMPQVAEEGAPGLALPGLCLNAASPHLFCWISFSYLWTSKSRAWADIQQHSINCGKRCTAQGLCH